MMKKRIIITSMISILISLSLISTATFALFTSESKKNVNITAGEVLINATLENLKTYSLDKEQTSGSFQNGGTAVYQNSTLSLDKVSPGDKVTFTLKIVNKSNIGVKYMINVTSNGELIKALVMLENDAELRSPKWNYLTSNDNGKIIEKEYSIELPLHTGNEYQKLSSDIVISVYAVQANAPEEALDGKITVNGFNYNSLEEAVNVATGSNSTVYVLGNIDVEGALGTSQTKDFSGVLIEGTENAQITFKNVSGSSSTGTCTFNNLNLKNIKVVDETYYSSENGENAWEFTYLEFAGNNNFEQVHFDDGIMITSGHTNFIDCSFIGHDNDSSTFGNVTMYGAWVYSGSANFTNCDFTGTRGLKVADYYSGSDVTKVVVEGCSFGPLSEKPGIAVDNRIGSLELIIKNCTFTNTQPGEQGNYIYEDDNKTPASTIIVLENNVVN